MLSSVYSIDNAWNKHLPLRNLGGLSQEPCDVHFTMGTEFILFILAVTRALSTKKRFGWIFQAMAKKAVLRRSQRDNSNLLRPYLPLLEARQALAIKDNRFWVQPNIFCEWRYTILDDGTRLSKHSRTRSREKNRRLKKMAAEIAEITDRQVSITSLA